MLINKSCNFDILNPMSCHQQIMDAIVNNVPYSFIRLGDGEGALLDFSNASTISDIDYLCTHFGPTISIDNIFLISNKLRQSIVNADLVGVRDDIVNVGFDHQSTNKKEFLSEFKRKFHLREIEQSLPLCDATRIAMLHKNLERIKFNNSTSFCSSWMQYDLYKTGGVVDLLSHASKMAIITSNVKAAGTLTKSFEIDVKSHLIDDMYECQSNTDYDLYPNTYNKIIDELDADLSGVVYIVAAGFLGKCLCYEIKQRGGIALDFGALVDCWVGRYSRPKVLKSHFKINKYWFKKKDRVPGELLMTPENINRLQGLWKENFRV